MVYDIVHELPPPFEMVLEYCKAVVDTETPAPRSTLN
jgi:hypothetical protein